MDNQEDSVDRFSLPPRYQTSLVENSQNNIWDEYGKLITEYKPVNLAAGYQDFPIRDHVKKALVNIANGTDYLVHQYTQDYGHPRLLKALSKLYSQLTDHEINPASEILITSGAFEALYCSIEGYITPDDEVIIIEPYFTYFETMVKCAGGKPVFIELHPEEPISNKITSSDWILNPVELASKFNSRTKAIMLNTPNNPLGKVFTLEELSVIADLCKKWNVLCISDEVYEFITYKHVEHIRIATLPGMWERTITIGSGGKIFGVTGWKIGWAYGDAAIMRNLIIVHKNSISSLPTPLQETIAQLLELEYTRFGQEDSYLKTLPQELEVKRDFMVKFLSDAGMVPVIPDGGYFMLANWSNGGPYLNLIDEKGDYKDIQFTKWLIKYLKIFCLPSSIYYNEFNKHIGEKYIRLCFIKKDETINEAANVLNLWKANDFKVNL